MSFPTSFSSLQSYTTSTRKRLSTRRSSSFYQPLHTDSPGLHPDSFDEASSEPVSPLATGSSVPTLALPAAAASPATVAAPFDGRRLSRHLTLRTRKSPAASLFSSTEALQSPSTSTTRRHSSLLQQPDPPLHSQSQPPTALLVLDNERLATSSSDALARDTLEPPPDSPASDFCSPLHDQTLDPPSASYGVCSTSATATPPQSRRPSGANIITSLEDRRRKLVRTLSRNDRGVIRRGDSSAPESDSKMHQTSSRLLRMTDDDRPFTRDFKDLFSTLMVSLPLTPHRVRFRQIEHTFTSEEAITNLGSLKFSQSNRMPDPKDPSRIVTTTTTTTFSMAKEMARSVCQKFLDARFIESVDGKVDFSSKSAVWQLTPKGMHILHRFCLRNGIQQDHVRNLLESPRNTMKLVILEREADTDRLSHDQATVEVIFRRFIGSTPNAKTDLSTSDSDSLNEYSTGLVGVKMAEDRKVGDRVYKKTFTGKAATDWLMDCCTMVDRRETIEIATLFVEYGLISPVESYPATNGRFQAAKNAIYYVTDRGQRIAGWIASPQGSVNGDAAAAAAAAAVNNKSSRDNVVRDSNTNRMQVIVRDPALRLLFREYLRHTHCEENLSFYIDVEEFLNNYRAAKRANSTPKLEFIRETLAAAYSLYNAFLAPGSPCELNIDHSLRIALASRMTRAVGDDEAMIKSLDEVASLFDQAQTTVFKLMATDSVPKFTRDPKYASILRERHLDFGTAHNTA